MVKDINPGPDSSLPYGFTAVDHSFYFGASDGVHGWELWRSDGTARGTRMVKDISPGTASTELNGLVADGRHALLLGLRRHPRLRTLAN